LVSAALDRVEEVSGHLFDGATARKAVVVGAGSMASLATATLTRRGATDIVVVNRTPDRAVRLATEHGVRAAALADLAEEIQDADLVVACTGSTGVLLTTDMVASLARPLDVVDLALPHDVEPGVGELPGVTLVTLADLADDLAGSDAGAEVDAVREIVTQEVAAFLNARRQASVTPTVVALRSMATEVVDAELARLLTRLPDLDDASRDEVLQSLRRVADKLLHQPTVRVKELADETGAVSYAAALAELFALDPDAVDAVTRPGGLAP
jgi:glutamyl-tRNA reductase